jgi:hypothetical protein
LKTIRIGAGAGYSGDRIPPAVELVEHGRLDYLVFECLAERTIALAQLDKMRDARLGFDPLLRDRMDAVLLTCARKGIRIITNMGAANPAAAAQQVVEAARALGIDRLKVAVVEGDDVLAFVETWEGEILETGQGLASVRGSLVSANAYLGAEGIVRALKAGADVVVTGRVSDPALFLAPLVHEFDWPMTDWHRLGQGIAVGHLLECAGQITGGYFADPGYRDVPDLARLGFPIAEVAEDGTAVITKLEGSGGCVTVATCTAQLLYEVEHPGQYLQPDVVADFSQVRLVEVGKDRVQVTGATGAQRPPSLKVTLGYRDGFVGEGQISYAGPGAVPRGQLALDVLRERLAAQALQGSEQRFELIGLNAIHGPALSRAGEPYEVRARVAVRTPDRADAVRVANEVEAMYLNGPAGGGGVTKFVREVIAAVSVLIPREPVRTTVTMLEL